MLEGTIQYELKELVKYLISRGIITLKNINSRVEQFACNDCDVVNKPSPIKVSSKDHSLKQSGESLQYVRLLHICNAIINFSFANVVPLIIGDCVPETDEYWGNFLILLRIMDYVFAPVSSRSIAAYLATLIEDYLTTFTELYPNCPVIPKQHYMVHIPLK